jgi:hypothetical protein
MSTAFGAVGRLGVTVVALGMPGIDDPLDPAAVGRPVPHAAVVASRAAAAIANI